MLKAVPLRTLVCDTLTSSLWRWEEVSTKGQSWSISTSTYRSKDKGWCSELRWDVVGFCSKGYPTFLSAPPEWAEPPSGGAVLILLLTAWEHPEENNYYIIITHFLKPNVHNKCPLTQQRAPLSANQACIEWGRLKTELNDLQSVTTASTCQHQRRQRQRGQRQRAAVWTCRVNFSA